MQYTLNDEATSYISVKGLSVNVFLSVINTQKKMVLNIKNGGVVDPAFGLVKLPRADQKGS